MRKIDFTNYEAWLLDYAEGTLSAGDTADLLLFLEQHPELKADLDGLVDFTLPAETPTDAGLKPLLHKEEPVVKAHFESLCLAFYDKRISAAEKKELDHLLQQKPQWEKEFKAFSHTYFTPEPDIEFSAKLSLKKQFEPEGSFDHQAVKAIEGLFSTQEKAAFEHSIEGHADQMHAWKAFRKTVLPRETIVFEHKELLYQQTGGGRVLPFYTRWIAAAASIALLIGVFSIYTQRENRTGLAGIQPDTSVQVRPVKPHTAPHVIPNTNGSSATPGKNNSGEKQNQQLPSAEIPEVNLRASFAGLTSLKPQTIEEFELPLDYLTISPEQNMSLHPQGPTAAVEPQYISPKQYLFNKAKGLLSKSRMDVETPLQELKEDGLAETGYRSIERISRGNINIAREKTPEGQRVTGFSIGSLEFSRSNGR